MTIDSGITTVGRWRESGSGRWWVSTRFGGEQLADEQFFMPPTMLGVVYWKDYVVGVVDDHEQAEDAVAALIADGWADSDAQARTGDFVTRNHRYFLENRDALQSLMAVLPSNESEVMNDFVDEAAKGHSIVAVRAVGDTDTRRVADVLRQHGAHHLVHYRGTTYVNL
jgi:hypothetical protein